MLTRAEWSPSFQKAQYETYVHRNRFSQTFPSGSLRIAIQIALVALRPEHGHDYANLVEITHDQGAKVVCWRGSPSKGWILATTREELEGACYVLSEEYRLIVSAIQTS